MDQVFNGKQQRATEIRGKVLKWCIKEGHGRSGSHGAGDPRPATRNPKFQVVLKTTQIPAITRCSK